MQTSVNQKIKRVSHYKSPIFINYPYFQLQYHEVLPQKKIAILALNDLCLTLLHPGALESLRKELTSVIDDPAVKTLIITGEERKVLNDAKTWEKEVAQVDLNGIYQLMDTIDKSDMPTLIAVQKGALGVASDWLGVGHLVIADSEAIFNTWMGNTPLWAGATQRLPRRCQAVKEKAGVHGAIKWLMSGDVMDSAQACQIGLVDQIVKDKDVLVTAIQTAREYIVAQDGNLYRAYVRMEALKTDWNLKKRFQHDFSQYKQTPYHAMTQKCIETGYLEGVKRGLQLEQEWMLSRTTIKQEMGRLKVELPKYLDHVTAVQEQEWQQTGQLLRPGSSFYPRFTTLPAWQYAHQVKVDEIENEIEVDKKLVAVRQPKSLEVVVYMLASEYHARELNRQTERPTDFGVSGKIGLGLVVAVGSEVKRSGQMKIGEFVTVNLHRHASNPYATSEQHEIDLQGTHQQFSTVHVSQCTLGNHLWGGYWNQRELSIKIIPFAEIEQQLTSDIFKEEQHDVVVIQHAMPRLDFANEQELLQAWGE
ncbi:hypothetical protein IC620_04930 [Hazenella sp. IB182357]|uniref:Enoyl-CoA hydratase/isomerase family protein n=1 Tax=Polycladospora coralii TaxID=2771432 RepID=A0A926RTS4_9BACL|nr:enoyl-CoA hydratase/isomerase family protein [Polycladospora coralii]MBD1371702.1 hypothetical protein [Polycladospora coralii]MBS7529169.1 hypothetical protein [Polycladospora coralii]